MFFCGLISVCKGEMISMMTKKFAHNSCGVSCLDKGNNVGSKSVARNLQPFTKRTDETIINNPGSQIVKGIDRNTPEMID